MPGAKLLYVVGNLFGDGGPWAVKATGHFDTYEIHGPFSYENEANNYAHALVESGERVWKSVEVVRIETPKAGVRIVYQGGTYEYE